MSKIDKLVNKISNDFINRLNKDTGAEFKIIDTVINIEDNSITTIFQLNGIRIIENDMFVEKSYDFFAGANIKANITYDEVVESIKDSVKK